MPSIWRYTQQSNRSREGGVDGDDDDDDEGSGRDNNDGGYGGRDGHHRMRKGTVDTVGGMATTG